jgi:hypothetical protein
MKETSIHLQGEQAPAQDQSSSLNVKLAVHGVDVHEPGLETFSLSVEPESVFDDLQTSIEIEKLSDFAAME